MSELEVVRRAFAEVARYPAVTMVPISPPGWTTARFGLGPFPARVVLDSTSGNIKAQVALVGFPTAPIEGAMGRVPYPSPQVHIALAPDVPPILEYVAPFARFDADEGVGLIAACAMYSVALLEELFRDLDRSVRRSYTKAGFKQRHGFGGDARDLLRSSPVPYAPWDHSVTATTGKVAQAKKTAPAKKSSPAPRQSKAADPMAAVKPGATMEPAMLGLCIGGYLTTWTDGGERFWKVPSGQIADSMGHGALARTKIGPDAFREAALLMADAGLLMFQPRFPDATQTGVQFSTTPIPLEPAGTAIVAWDAARNELEAQLKKAAEWTRQEGVSLILSVGGWEWPQARSVEVMTELSDGLDASVARALAVFDTWQVSPFDVAFTYGTEVRPVADVGVNGPLEDAESLAADRTSSAEDWARLAYAFEHILVAFGDTFSIEVGPAYIQGSRSGDSINLEAVSNEFLSGSDRLSPQQVSQLLEIGWEPPDDKVPNFSWWIPSFVLDVAATSVMIVQTLRDVYGAALDDDWGISPVELHGVVAERAESWVPPGDAEPVSSPSPPEAAGKPALPALDLTDLDLDELGNQAERLALLDPLLSIEQLRKSRHKLSMIRSGELPLSTVRRLLAAQPQSSELVAMAARPDLPRAELEVAALEGLRGRNGLPGSFLRSGLVPISVIEEYLDDGTRVVIGALGSPLITQRLVERHLLTTHARVRMAALRAVENRGFTIALPILKIARNLPVDPATAPSYWKGTEIAAAADKLIAKQAGGAG